MKGFLDELMRRRVLRATGGYLVFAWIVAQVTSVVFPPIGLGPGAQRVVLAVLTAGFPLIVILAWLYEFTPDGLKRERTPDKPRGKAGRVADPLIALAIFALSAFFMWDILVRAPERTVIAQDETSAQNQVDPASIAVLPFVNMSANRDVGYFGDGLTEEIIHALVKIDGLKVAGRTSSFYYKGRDLDLRQIGQQLGVAMVLEGSVRRESETLKVTAQLINSADGFHIWSETYDVSTERILGVQEEIAAQVFRRVREKGLIGAKQASGSLADLSFQDSTLYPDYLLALTHFRHNSVESLNTAESILQRIIKIEPDNASAHALLARVIVEQWRKGGLSDLSRYDLAENAARRAVSLAPTSADARFALATAHYIRNGTGAVGALDQYREDLQKAYVLDPNNVDVLLRMVSDDMLSPSEKAATFETLFQRDPLNPDLLLSKAESLISDREWVAARKHLQEAMALHPDFTELPYTLARMEEYLGNLAAAADAMELAIDSGGAWRRQLLASYCASMGDMDCARRTLDVEGDDKLQARLAMLNGDLEASRDLFSFTFHASIIAGKQGDWEGAADYLRQDFPQWLELNTPPDPSGVEDGYLWTARVLLGTGNSNDAHVIARSLVQHYTSQSDADSQHHMGRNILAGAYAVLGEQEKAIDTLETSVNAGFRNSWKALRWQNLEWPPNQHPVFDSLWENRRFKNLMTRLENENAKELENWKTMKSSTLRSNLHE